jgi:hypothetical protein
MGNMDHAFEHCFSEYVTCPSYHELLSERRTKQETTQLTIHGKPPATSSVPIRVA